MFGLWETEYSSGWGQLIDCHAEQPMVAVFVFHFPEIPPNMFNNGRPAVDYEVVIDISEYRENGTLQISIPLFNEGNACTYHYSGQTEQEGYEHRIGFS